MGPEPMNNARQPPSPPTATARSKVAILHTFATANGGSEHEALDFFRLLSPHHEVELWAEGPVDPVLQQRWPIRQISVRRGAFPRHAHLVFVGAVRFGFWVWLARAGVISIIANTVQPRRLKRRVRRLRWVPKDDLRIFYVSADLARQMPYPGTVIPSPIDLERFRPAPKNWDGLRIGRLSRDEPYKHGDGDPQLYRVLAREGWEVLIRGGTCLAGACGNEPRIDLSPASPDQPERFLQGLDVFFYRTRDDWFESFGRVVLEAMACGIPVVVHHRGGYNSFIRHGENGFLFRTDDEALECIRRLGGDADLRARMGQAACATAQRLFSVDRLQEIASQFVTPGAPRQRAVSG